MDVKAAIESGDAAALRRLRMYARALRFWRLSSAPLMPDE